MNQYQENIIRSESRKRYLSTPNEVFDIICAKGLDSIAKQDLEENIILSEQTMSNCKKISLTTSCMDRNEFLLESFKTWIKLPFNEIIIIDWNSKVPVLQTLTEHYGNSLNKIPVSVRVIRFDNKRYYEHSKVRNIKIQECKTDWILCIDCDVMLTGKFGSFFELTNTKRYYGNVSKRSDRGLYGTALFSKQMFEELGKFDEDIKFWGSEDVDFYQRATESGYKFSDIRSITMKHQEHSDDLRSKNTPYESIWRSNSENCFTIAMKSL